MSYDDVRLIGTSSLPNLFRNGGFETKDFDFWVLDNMAPALTTGAVTSTNGCRTYATVSLTNNNPVQIYQQYDVSAGGLLDHDENARVDIGLKASLVTDLSMNGCDLTAGLAVRVIGGKVNIYALFAEKDSMVVSSGDTTNIVYYPVSIASNYIDSDWQRVSVNHTSSKYVCRVGFRFEKVSGSPTISFGNMQLVEGAFGSLVYTGCLFSDSMPRSAHVFCMGVQPPPGFDIAYESEKFFIRIGEPGSTGGELSHTHEISQHMADAAGDAQADSWLRRLLLNDPQAVTSSASPGQVATTNSDTFVDSGEVIHQHDIYNPGGVDNSVPNYRGYILCRKK